MKLQTRKVDANEIYQELDSYIRLSQEEIDSLYIEAGITEKSYSCKLRELEGELRKKKNVLAEERLLCAVFEDDVSSSEEDIQKLEEQIEILKKKASTPLKQLLSATTKRSSSSRKYPSNELRNQVFLGTIGIARYFAKTYYYKVRKQYRFDYDDLFQIACEGLLSACHYYVPTGEATFKTYASRCIENCIKRNIRLSKRTKQKSITFEDELDRTHILKSFLEKEVFRGFGKIFELESFEERPSVALYRLNQVILSYNQEVLNLGEPEKVWKKVCKKRDRERSFEKLQEIFDMFEKFFKDGKICTLITDEDRELAYLLSQKKNYKEQDAQAFILFEYLEIYMMRLYQIDNYLKVEGKLLEENDGILPDESIILKKLNQFVQETNQMLKKGNWYHPTNILEKRTSFFQEYEEAFDANLIDPEEGEEYLGRLRIQYKDIWMGTSLTTDEEEELFYDDGELFTYTYTGKMDSNDISDFIETLEDCKNCLEMEYRHAQKKGLDRIVFCMGLELTYQNEKISRTCISGYAFQKGPDGYTLEDALHILSEEIENIKVMVSKCNALEKELNRRKEQVKEIVKTKNEPIFKKNREQKDRLRLYHILDDCNRIKLKKWDTTMLKDIQNYIQLIYCDDETLMGFVERKKSAKRRVEKSLEEEVLVHQFFEDYNQALENLPPIPRRIWQSWYDEDGTHTVTAKSLAKELGISESKVYQEKEKGKALLKKDPTLCAYYKESF